MRNNVPLTALTAVSAVDGRYHARSVELSEYFSEYGLMRKRLLVECEYLIALSAAPGVGMRVLTAEEKTLLRQLPNISLEEAEIVKKIERVGYENIPATNHDVKAVEYFIKRRLASTSLRDVAEWTHFALTSEDINSIAYGLALRSAVQSVVFVAIEEVRRALDALARSFSATPMLARTHGQPASPTTFGKEMRVFEQRLARQLEQLVTRPVLVKFAGATGNYNAHVVALPEINWPKFADNLVARLNEGYRVPIELNRTTTQIEPHDTYAELFDNVRRVNTILLDLSQDIWRYISDGWLTQSAKEGEIGSSAMPHKVNPIDFENAEGNLGIANALFEHFSRKLPVSRLQRDLSDSTVLRAIGSAFAHSLIAYRSLTQGFDKIGVNAEAMRESLQAHPEVLAEAIQTVLRKAGVAIPYEQMKALTRGRKVSLEDFAKFIDALSIADDVKAKLKVLRPEAYVGIAQKIAEGS